MRISLGPHDDCGWTVTVQLGTELGLLLTFYITGIILIILPNWFFHYLFFAKEAQ